MQVIKRLPIHLSNQIAAGEVVQRPASVVKELLENSIDAGSTEIVVSIKDGGRTLISISDNGTGMNEQDALVCFERYATSKLSSIDDLFQLRTMGFRGEALASIAAVSQVDLKTRIQGAATGIHVRFEGGNLISQEELICAKGTLMEVKNLFFNIPARRNFLKSDSIEFNHIEDAFLCVALAHPEVSLVLHNNNQPVYNLDASNFKRRISEILGKGGADKIFPISSDTDIVSIHGFLGKPETAKKTRGNQFFFANRRFFKNSYLNHAVQRAFENLIPDKTHPVYFIFFDIKPEKMDVNIHPTKTEIKFEEERSIYSLLLSTIRQSLGKYNLMPSLDFELETAFDLPSSFRQHPVQEPTILVDPSFNPFNSEKKSREKTFSPAIKKEGFGSGVPNTSDWKEFYQVTEEPVTSNPIPELNTHVATEFIGSGKYLLAKISSGLLLIDTKRALERILYDESIEAFVKHPLNSQMLLFPIEKSLEKHELRLIQPHTALLEQFGFKFEIQDTLLTISGAPEILHDEGILTCFEAFMNRLEMEDQQQQDLAHILLADMAKTSAKYYQIGNKSEMQQLVDQLFRCSDHHLSPSHEKIISIVRNEDLTQFLK
ncbi:MAG: DNA mismatch repair endonuclease MutL [Bacteroidetes bacterium]|nr:DNA mismatch repair endonuclease MutL [Bacteroidota bacterium]MBM3424702.1 DNA mismatch repair endonuclease MutL [Bacteroidota bacterium]